MQTKLNTLIFRKLKITDFKKFKKLFYKSFNRKISYNFFKWRYIDDKLSFCFGVFYKSDLIANVGMVSNKLNNRSKERVFSRHSSMVSPKFRGIGIFSILLKKVKKKISKKISLVIMWPNKNNFSYFGIDKKKIIKKKYFIYKTLVSKSKFISTKNFHIKKLPLFKNFLKTDKSFFLKDYNYFKNRYLSYKKNDYFINKFEYRNSKSFFIIKRNRIKSGFDYVLLDHFGCSKIYLNHFSNLLSEQKKLIFLSNKKLNNKVFKFINDLNFNLVSINEKNKFKKKLILLNKEIFLGDTDIFITI